MSLNEANHKHPKDQHHHNNGDDDGKQKDENDDGHNNHKDQDEDRNNDEVPQQQRQAEEGWYPVLFSETTTTTTRNKSNECPRVEQQQHQDDDCLYSSNPHLARAPPMGLRWHPQVMTCQEEEALYQSLLSHQDSWRTEGFEQRRRVQRWIAPFPFEEEWWKEQTPFGPLLHQWVHERNLLPTFPDMVVVQEITSHEKGKKPVVFHFESGTGQNDDDDMALPSMTTLPACCPVCLGKEDGNENHNKDEPKTKKDACCCCTSLVAQVTLRGAALVGMEKPLHRKMQCWPLAVPVEQSSMELLLKPRGLLIKSKQVLWGWRCRTSQYQPPHLEQYGKLSSTRKKKKKKKQEKEEDDEEEEDGKCLVLSFRRVRPWKDPCASVPPPPAVPAAPPTPSPPLPLRELLTIVVTTSPIRSNPSTEVLEQTFATFPHGGDEFAYECPKIIICDGCRVLPQDDDDHDKKDNLEKAGSSTASSPRVFHKVTRKHANVKQALRNGVATWEQAQRYEAFKRAVRQLCCCSSSERVFGNTTVVELTTRHGYGFSLRHALEHHVQTPYVCVIQHDRTLMRPAPMRQVVETMRVPQPSSCGSWVHVKYVGLSMRSNLLYRDVFVSKYGKHALATLNRMTLWPSSLQLDSRLYGPHRQSSETTTTTTHPNGARSARVYESMEQLQRTYPTSRQGQAFEEATATPLDKKKKNSPSVSPLCLTPTLFWYDNIHICETAHYRSTIFQASFPLVARGGFVEDKVSPAMLRAVERWGLVEGHGKFASFLLDDGSGLYFTGHLDGGSYRSNNVVAPQEEEGPAATTRSANRPNRSQQHPEPTTIKRNDNHKQPGTKHNHWLPNQDGNNEEEEEET